MVGAAPSSSISPPVVGAGPTDGTATNSSNQNAPTFYKNPTGVWNYLNWTQYGVVTPVKYQLNSLKAIVVRVGPLHPQPQSNLNTNSKLAHWYPFLHKILWNVLNL